MQVDPRIIKQVLVNKLWKFRQMNLPEGTLVRMHPDLLTKTVDSLYILEEQVLARGDSIEELSGKVSQLEARIVSLERENTLLSLSGRGR